MCYKKGPKRERFDNSFREMNSPGTTGLEREKCVGGFGDEQTSRWFTTKKEGGGKEETEDGEGEVLIFTFSLLFPLPPSSRPRPLLLKMEALWSPLPPRMCVVWSPPLPLSSFPSPL